MILSCEQCGTRYNLDETLLGPQGSKVRCSKCLHVFTAWPSGPVGHEPLPEMAAETGTAARDRAGAFRADVAEIATEAGDDTDLDLDFGLDESPADEELDLDLGLDAD